MAGEGAARQTRPPDTARHDGRAQPDRRNDRAHGGGHRGRRAVRPGDGHQGRRGQLQRPASLAAGGVRRRPAPRHKPDGRDQLLIVSPPPDQQPAALVQVWTDLPDEAITALSQLLYDMRGTQSRASDAGKRWYWNTSSHRWELLQLPQGHGSHADTASST